MLRGLFFLWMPLLFLPNFGLVGLTSYGTLAMSDFLILPFLSIGVLVILLEKQGGSLPTANYVSVQRLFYWFLLWAVFTVLLIGVRYDYTGNHIAINSFLKIGKLWLYGVSGLLISRMLKGRRSEALFLNSMFACGTIVGISLVLLAPNPEDLRGADKAAMYLADNATSIMLAILLCYLLGVQAVQRPARFTWWLRLICLVVMIIGFLLSYGRGGWLAAACGVVYLSYRLGISKKFLLMLVVGFAAIVYAYFRFPAFQQTIDRTLWPDQQFLIRYNAGVGGFDDGARLHCWQAHLPKLLEYPIFGTGYFHRGGQSGIWYSGSHNYFLQIFLETGLVGGLLVIAMFWRMWSDAGSRASVESKEEIPVKVALITAVIGGMGGEYFYAGLVLFVLFVVYARVGCLVEPPIQSVRP